MNTNLALLASSLTFLAAVPACSSATDGAPETNESASADLATAPPNAPPTPYLACNVDSDCVAVGSPAPCCDNGWKHAVNRAYLAQWEQANRCPRHPICPMYIVLDTRVPECDNTTHQCAMVQPSEISCGGFIQNAHACASGMICKPPPQPDGAGHCVLDADRPRTEEPLPE